MILCKNKGFTVVETMIFLAVSSVIFISVASLISGQLNNSQAKDSINNIESVVRGVLNDVTNGYYPEFGDMYTCTIIAGKPSVGPSGGSDRGTHNDCILIGKKVTFKQYEVTVETLVARRVDTTLDSGLFTSITGIAGANDLKETKKYNWGLEHEGADQVYYILNTSFGADSTVSGAFATGAQAVKIYFGNSLVSPIPATDKNVCFNRGSGTNKLKLIVAKDEALTVESDSSGGPCP